MSDANPSGGGKVELDPRLDFFAGTVAGMASLVVGFPFDTVKVRFQSPEIARKYSSTYNAIAVIIREERFSGLFKGITSPLASVAFMNGLVFSSYRFLMKLQLDNSASVPTLGQIALAGAGSGIVSSIVTTPIELIKIRQQQSLLTPSTAISVALQIHRTTGIRGLYRGVTVTALRDCGYGAYFCAYEATCRLFAGPSRPKLSADHTSVLAEVESHLDLLSWSKLLLAGGVAGIAGWVATFPLDVVKTRIQGNSVDPVSPRAVTSTALSQGKLCSAPHLSAVNPYRTTFSTIIYSYRTEGLGVFFRGLTPTLIRAIPVNMVTFATFETIVHAFS